MPYKGMPFVRNQQLHLPDGSSNIPVDSPAWFSWLQSASHFSFALGRPSFYWITFRREKRRHRDYWYAYLKSEAKLHNAYAGRSDALSSHHLRTLAQTLVDKVTQTQRPIRTKETP